MKDREVMPILEFGKALLDTGDLDPVYTMLHKAQLEDTQLRKWLVAYWCFYSSGAAAWITESSNFWVAMETAAANETPAPNGQRWPRGRERRHFRGEKCVQAIRTLMDRYPNPELMLIDLESASGPYPGVKKVVTSWPMFGPWIAFKIGDMLERIVGVWVDFSDSDVFMFDTPKQAAYLWYGEESETAIHESVKYLDEHLGNRLAPPSFNRSLNIQEYETILCKWKSHNNGHYPIGIDTRELREGLHPWIELSDLARRLHATLHAS